MRLSEDYTYTQIADGSRQERLRGVPPESEMSGETTRRKAIQMLHQNRLPNLLCNSALSLSFFDWM